ncbi:efflux RND transporter permease subunit [Oceanispirochaeta crateris]|uniref:Efflux RND transporter permease subunit n=1 Tax=Oceanispirochaeta crateris TaxID=2518645 RepID=A0A5C1QJ95_9SPIO|nr:efflux RND transporter permease subunit [Oceanispirochaeta crateris]QEN07239.1 efflux RND transporter permease subunit [Oceanispirochaeta crateris]
MIDSAHRNRAVLLLLTLSLLFVLIIAELQFSYYPQSGRKILSISIELKGVWQDQIETLITNPLESNLLRMNHVKKMISRSEDEQSQITLFLDDDANLGKCYLELREILDRMDFPERTQKPRISKNDNNALPVFILQTEYGLTEEKVESLFKQVKGVGQIDVSVVPKKDVNIQVKQDMLHSINLTTGEMAQILNRENLPGCLEIQGQKLLLLDFRYSSIDDFYKQQITRGMCMGDISEIVLSDAIQPIQSRVNGEEKPMVWIKESGDANTISLCRQLRSIRTQLGRTQILYDKGMLIEQALKEILQILIFSLISVMGITFLLLGDIKSSIILCLNIPFSLSGTLALFRIFGWEIDVLVLAGLALSTGLIIDSGVIYLERGRSRSFRPIIFSLISTLLVFTSFLFAPYEVKIQNSGLIGALCFSLILSVFYILIIMNGILQIKNPGRKQSRRKLLEGLFIPLFNFRYISCIALFILFIICILSIQNITVTQEFPLPDPSLHFSIEYPAGVGKNKIIEELSFFEEELSHLNDAEFYTSSYRDEKANFHIRLKDERQRNDLIQKIRRTLSGIEGFLYFQSRDNGAESVISLEGYDRSVLYAMASDLAKSFHLITGNPVIQHYKKQPSLVLLTPKIERFEAGSLSPGQLASILDLHLNRPVLGKWFPPGLKQMDQRVYDVHIFDPDDKEMSLQDLKRFRVPNNTVEPLISFTDFSDEKAYGVIYHENGLRSLSFSLLHRADAQTGQLKNLSQTIQQVLNQNPLPEGIKMKWGENERAQQHYIRGLFKSLFISLMLLLLLLFFLYESFFLPLYLFSQILLCHLVSLAALKISGMPLSSPVFFSLILNTGLLINNGLVIFGDYSKKKPSYTEVIERIKLCSPTLVIAGLTTLAGLIPLFFRPYESGGMLPALSLTVSSGLLFSLILQLVSIPLFFNQKD